MDKNSDLVKAPTLDNYASEKINVISNCLLGNYVDGHYVIAPEIKQELINVKKTKKSVFRNSVFCGAFIEAYGDLVFEVIFQKNTVKNAAMAELFVLENENRVNGYIQNTIRSKVGEYIASLDDFIQNAYNHFNIALSEGDGGKEYKNMEDISFQAYINAKKNFSLNMGKLTQKDYNKLYKGFVTKRLEIMKQLNSPYTNSILEQFNNEYAKIEQYFLKDNNYKALNELLDKCVEDCSGINPLFAEQEKEYRQTMMPVIDEFSKEADNIAGVATPRAMQDLSKNDRVRMEEMGPELYGQSQTPSREVYKEVVNTHIVKTVVEENKQKPPENKVPENKDQTSTQTFVRLNNEEPFVKINQSEHKGEPPTSSTGEISTSTTVDGQTKTGERRVVSDVYVSPGIPSDAGGSASKTNAAKTRNNYELENIQL